MARLCTTCGEHPCACPRSPLIGNDRLSPRGTLLCNWETQGRICNMIAGDGRRCQWHQRWAVMVEDRVPIDEETALDDWLQQFRPGGDYAHSPGQWWAQTAILLFALRGLGANPVMDDEIRRELQIRHAEAQRMRLGLPLMDYPGPRIGGSPLPDFNILSVKRLPQPRLEAMKAQVRRFTEKP